MYVTIYIYRRGRGGAWGGGGWDDINTHIDMIKDIDVHIIINMNIKYYIDYIYAFVFQVFVDPIPACTSPSRTSHAAPSPPA